MNFTAALTNALATANYRQLQRTLKAYRAEGNEVRVKLNAKKGLLMAEARRVLEALKAAEAPVEISWVTFYHTIKNSAAPKATWRSLCMTHHPDHGGDQGNFINLMEAWNYYRAA
jgi:seryl-tRNA(Sec) selenium transferase